MKLSLPHYFLSRLYIPETSILFITKEEHSALRSLNIAEEFNLKPWDIAAGILLVREAGGFVSGLYPNQNRRLDGHVLSCLGVSRVLMLASPSAKVMPK